MTNFRLPVPDVFVSFIKSKLPQVSFCWLPKNEDYELYISFLKLF